MLLLKQITVISLVFSQAIFHVTHALDFDPIKKKLSSIDDKEQDLLGCYKNPNSDGSCPTNDITFWFYTRNFPNGIQIINSNSKTLPVDIGKPWKIIFHGFRCNRLETPGDNLRKAYFARGSYNIICIDASKPFMKNLSDLCYARAALFNVDLVAKCTAIFIKDMINAGVLPSPNELHFIGHSLGAHTAAFTSSNLAEYSLSKVFRLTGLDPAGPLFGKHIITMIRNMNSLDGLFVDVHHTNSGEGLNFYGTTENLGHVDIKYNDGSNQPGCGNDTSCSHQRTVDYFAESIQPLSPDQLFYGRLESDNSDVLVGEDISLDIKGIVSVTTNDVSPFAQGK